MTVYTYEGPSVNFGRQTNSIFYAVAGPESVLKKLHAAISGVRGTDVRYGDHIPAGSCVRRYHLQEGVVWRVSDEDDWESARGSVT